MKKLVLILGLVSMANAFGAFAGPLLTYQAGPGFTLPEYRVGVLCELYPDKLVIRKKVYGFAESTEIRKVDLDVGSVLKSIEEASKGEIEETVGPTDMPTYKYTGTKILPLDNVEEVLLASSSHVIRKNLSTEARALVNFINLHCK